MPKEDARKWHPQRDPMQRAYMHKPLMAFPPYHSNCGLPAGQIYPVWGHPSCPTPGIQMWGHPRYPAWQPPENWFWKTYPAVIYLHNSTSNSNPSFHTHIYMFVHMHNIHLRTHYPSGKRTSYMIEQWHSSQIFVVKSFRCSM